MIFIIDLDSTIIGDCKYQVARYNLIRNLKTGGNRIVRLNEIPPAYESASGLIRPGFADFIRTVRTHYPWSLIFVYTASDTQWAQHEIGWIQKSLGITVDGLFTRAQCTLQATGYRKSIRRILPTIHKSIAKTRKLAREEKDYVERHRIIIIDDSAVYDDFKDALLVCPAYNFQYFEDVLAGIDPAIIKSSPALQQIVLDLMNNSLVCASKPSVHMEYLANRYKWLAIRCKQVINANNHSRSDRFWYRLAKLVVKNNIAKFTAPVVQQLQRLSWKESN